MVTEIVKPALQFVWSLANKFLRNQKADSLIRFTKSTRVEPIVMVDQRVAHLPYITDVMQSLTSIFSGYYLQAIAIAVNVGRVNVIKLLDALNPQRDAADAAAVKIADLVVGKESLVDESAYRFGLPNPGQALSLEAKSDPGMGPHSPTFKDLKDHPDADTLKGVLKHGQMQDVIGANLGGKGAGEGSLKGDIANVGKGVDGAEFGKDAIKSLGESVNLSVGKMLEVTINDGNASATFPISVRLIATIVGSNILAHILGDGSRITTAKERYHAWRSGQLEFWRDLVFCQDLIDEHKKTLAQDTTGTYDEILRRRTGNQVSTALTATPSVATASNLLVMSKQTARELELSIRGKLSDFAVREKVLKSTYVMIMAVIDPEWEQVTFYHRGIRLPTQLNIKELKASNKGTGPDVAEILKAYQLGQNPTI